MCPHTCDLALLLSGDLCRAYAFEGGDASAQFFLLDGGVFGVGSRGFGSGEDGGFGTQGWAGLHGFGY